MSSLKTLVVSVDPDNPDKEVISYAARIIRSGGIVAFPTETVYGLAVNLADKKAVERLYSVKKRLRGKPLTIHIADRSMIRKAGCRITKKADSTIKKFWPGPLTMLLPSEDGSKIGFRMPANHVALELIRQADVPVGAPSANISGNKPPVDAKGVLKDMRGRIEMVIDAGRTKIGKESTIIDFTVNPPVILRKGAVDPVVLLKEARAV